MPRVHVIESAQPNAFATGRNPEHAAVAITTGLLNSLSQEEIAGVMAHELAHVKSRDTLIMTVTATVAGALGMLANFALFFGRGRDNPLGFIGVLLVAILSPLAAMLVQTSISRAREYEADRIGAEICGKPLWLASALGKLDEAAHRIDNNRAEANPATAHLFIVNPLHARKLDGLFSTHPSTEERIRRLGELARIVTDAGLVFITALEGVDKYDLEKLKLLNEPNELFVVCVGEAALGDFPPQVSLGANPNVGDAIERIVGALNASGVLPEYQI